MKITLVIEADEALLEELEYATNGDEPVTLGTRSLITTVYPRILAVQS